ncbi:MAG: cellulase family glycosylhydrolase [Planctomycetales bacterium]|nr:cellulase family glycosylhydrolase [Planctomycetales bacterium]
MIRQAAARICVGIMLAVALQGEAAPDELQRLGVNLAGAEFGPLPGVVNKDYVYPGAKQFDYCKAKGLRLVRLPFKWERIQPELLKPLDGEELGRLDHVAKLAHQRDVALVLDMHNFARYRVQLIGSDDVPVAAFADVWRRLAEHYREEAAIVAYGVMNEPHGTKGTWPAAAQACVDAIRTVDKTHVVLVCGDNWGGAHSWQKYNNNLVLDDPAHRLVYEAHQYFDHDNSGRYNKIYDADGANATTGVKRLQPFLEWLKRHNVRGFVGEFGVPDDDPRWLVVLDNALEEMRQHQVGGTYWAAGPWWNNYPLSLEPRDGSDRPQMAVMERHLAKTPALAPRPWIAAAEAAEAAAQAIREEDARLGRRVYDFRSRGESYHYKNDESEYASGPIEDAGRKARKITYRSNGNPAWVGVGVYFGALDCRGHDALSLDVRAEAPCQLEVKAYTADNRKFTAKYAVDSSWKTVAISLADLKQGDASFPREQRLQKIEFQPNASPAGNSLYLGALRLVAPAASTDP